MLGSFNDLDKYSKDNVDAAMNSFGVISKGIQALAVGAADYSKKSLEQGAEALERILSATSIEQALEIQSDYIKSAYEDFIAELNRVSELYADLAKEVCRPFELYFGTMPAPPYPQMTS